MVSALRFCYIFILHALLFLVEKPIRSLFFTLLEAKKTSTRSWPIQRAAEILKISSLVSDGRFVARESFIFDLTRKSLGRLVDSRRFHGRSHAEYHTNSAVLFNVYDGGALPRCHSFPNESRGRKTVVDKQGQIK